MNDPNDSPPHDPAPQHGVQPTPEPPPQDAPGARAGWDAELEQLRGRFPDAKNGVLFCLRKLEQNPEARLADFRDEASLYGIPLSGRSMHSAKVLLGMAEKSVRRTPKARPPATDAAVRPNTSPSQSLESQLTSALQQIQGAAMQQSQQLRDAMRQAIEVLQRALDDE